MIFNACAVHRRLLSGQRQFQSSGASWLQSRRRHFRRWQLPTNSDICSRWFSQ